MRRRAFLRNKQSMIVCENILGKQGTAVPTRAFWPAPAVAEADQKLVRATSLKPFNADKSAATHRSDAIRA